MADRVVPNRRSDAAKSAKYARELNRINAVIQSSLAIDAILSKVVVEVAVAIEAESAVIYLPDDHGWNARYVYGLPESFIGRRLTDEEVKYSVIAMEQKEPLVLNDPHRDGRVDQGLVKEYGIEAILDIALTAGDKAIGDFSLHYHDRNKKFTDLEVDFVSKAASSITLAMRNALLLDERAKAEERLQVSNRNLRLLLDLAARLLEAEAPKDAASVAFEMIAGKLELDVYFNYLAEKDGTLRLDSWAGIPDHVVHLISRLESGEAVCGMVALTQQPVHVPNVQEASEEKVKLIQRYGITAYYCNPLKVKGRFVGTLSFGTRRRNSFSDEETDMMQSVARYVALAQVRLQTEKELREAEKVAKRTADELARSNEELQQFGYMVSHDLQEPLRMISSYLQLLKKKYYGKLDDKANTYIHFAVDGASRMRKLIESLLSYSRLSRDMPVYPVDMREAVNNALANLETNIKESHAEITVETMPTVNGNETLLTQLFQNLVGNAVKYHKPGTPPHVRISAERNGPEWLFRVRDNGIGIDPQHFGRLFKLFRRLHTKEEYSGTGIGLASCKKIVEMHHGRIWVESAPDEGSTFIFTLPASSNLAIPISAQHLSSDGYIKGS